MAQKRMFDKSVITQDDFIELPLSAQALYFHLGMQADDDGVVDGIRGILRLIGASDDDFEMLCESGYLITLNNKVIVITHWHLHNYLMRYKPTSHITEFDKVFITDNKTYTLDDTGNKANEYMQHRGDCINTKNELHQKRQADIKSIEDDEFRMKFSAV